jgi:hypothetical protein
MASTTGIRVIVVAHGPPLAGGITTVALDLVEDPVLNSEFDVVFQNTAQAQDQRGKFSLTNLQRVVGDAWWGKACPDHSCHPTPELHPNCNSGAPEQAGGVNAAHAPCGRLGKRLQHPRGVGVGSPIARKDYGHILHPVGAQLSQGSTVTCPLSSHHPVACVFPPSDGVRRDHPHIQG